MIVLWPDREAQQILKQHGADPEKTYIFETGFGPSGKPHFGTFGEVVRTNYVMLAMKDQGYKTKLIAFSDDMDGLRKIPEGFPAWLKDYIGHPVSSIPDPLCDQHESYSAHMNALLVEMLEHLGLDFEFRSSTACYRDGTFNQQIETVIRNYEQIQEIIFPTLRDETKENWFPFFPICENCGSVGHTRVTNVDKENLLLTYVCDREFGGIPGCGHTGTVSPLNGKGKLQWKVDWPARWAAFGIHYEMFGKDLIESAEVGDRIMQRVFRTKPPTHMFYELFLAEDATKISKSKGTGMTAEEWQQYGTPESLMMLMLDKPSEAKRLYPGVVPRYMDMVNKSAEAHLMTGERNEAQERDARMYQFIHLFEPPQELPILIDYGTLANLVGNVGLSDPAIVEDYLHRSKLIPDQLSEAQRSDLHNLILNARRFYDEQMVLELAQPRFDEQDIALLEELIKFLEAQEHEADVIHNEIFQIAKRNNVEPTKFFRALYNALIKQERGPRGGAFIRLLGQKTAIQLIRQRLAEAAQYTEATDMGAVTSLEGLIPVRIAPDVKERYGDLRVGVAVIEGVEIKAKRSEDLDAMIKNSIAVHSRLEVDQMISGGAIASYRRLYESFGANPNAMPPSSEAILRMAILEGRLPEVNNLVDAVNLTVLETKLSAAVYDLDQLDLPLSLRFAGEGDKHLPLGTKTVSNVEKGELVYADEKEVICRAFNHRDSDKTKITTKTRNILLIVDGSPGISVDVLMITLETAAKRITTNAGGKIRNKALLL